MTYSAGCQQGAVEMFWLHFWGVLIFVYSQWNKPVGDIKTLCLMSFSTVFLIITVALVHAQTDMLVFIY